MKSELNCVLLIDDDEPTNFLNTWILEHSEFTGKIQVSDGGKDALDYLTNCIGTDKSGNFLWPGLILLDINMPAMNGWEFLERYKQLEKAPNCKTIIVMLTTTLFPEDLLRAKENPEISGFESKPLTPEILNRLFKQHFVFNS